MHSIKNITKGVALVALLVLVLAPLSPAIPIARAAITTTDRTAATNDIGCSVSSIGNNPGQALAICVSSFVYYIAVGLTSTIAYIAAYFFDLAVSLSLQSASYALDFISIGWTTVRDLANMAFIFILVFIALTIIFRAETSKTLPMLAGLIVVALLVNFSFFATRVVIDTGNILAVQFYNAIGGPNAPTISKTAGGAASAATAGSAVTNVLMVGGKDPKDLTASIMNALGVESLISTPSFQTYVKSAGNSAMFTLITLSLIYISMGIMFAILAGSFLFAGAKFVMRIVALWFIIIASPLAFIAAALGGGSEKPKKLFNQWLDHLIKFSFYPAVYLFMFLILTLFMQGLNQGNGGFLTSTFPAAGQSTGNMLATITTAIANVALRMGFVVAMLYLALSAAEMLVKEGSGYAKSFAGWAGNAVTGGAIGWTGRQTLGRVGRWTGNERLANATYDIRNSRLARITGIPALLRGFEPATRKPYEKIGATPIDYGKAADKGLGLTKKGQEKVDKEKRRQAWLEQREFQNAENQRIEEENRRRAGGNNPTPSQPPTTPPTPPTTPPVPPATSPTTPPGNNPPGGGRRQNQQQGQPQERVEPTLGTPAGGAPEVRPQGGRQEPTFGVAPEIPPQMRGPAINLGDDGLYSNRPPQTAQPAANTAAPEVPPQMRPVPTAATTPAPATRTTPVILPQVQPTNTGVTLTEFKKELRKQLRKELRENAARTQTSAAAQRPAAQPSATPSGNYNQRAQLQTNEQLDELKTNLGNLKNIVRKTGPQNLGNKNIPPPQKAA